MDTVWDSRHKQTNGKSFIRSILPGTGRWMSAMGQTLSQVIQQAISADCPLSILYHTAAPSAPEAPLLLRLASTAGTESPEKLFLQRTNPQPSCQPATRQKNTTIVHLFGFFCLSKSNTQRTNDRDKRMNGWYQGSFCCSKRGAPFEGLEERKEGFNKNEQPPYQWKRPNSKLRWVIEMAWRKEGMCLGTREKKTLGREGTRRETTYQKPEARKQEALLLCM